jgi:flagellar basal-body rod protein FlgF
MPPGLIELAEITLATAQRRLDAISQNVSNIATPGYKAQVGFQEAISATGNREPRVSFSSNLNAGALRETGRRFDLAIVGSGYFMVRGEDETFFTRNGQFDLDAQGRLLTSQGYALQSSDGGDVMIRRPDAEIASDGTVLEDGAPVSRVGVFNLTRPEGVNGGGELFRAVESDLQVEPDAQIRQGMVEGGNVELANEMIEMMKALRLAEAGARVVQAYDSLIGQSINTFGRGGGR